MRWCANPFEYNSMMNSSGHSGKRNLCRKDRRATGHASARNPTMAAAPEAKTRTPSPPPNGWDDTTEPRARLRSELGSALENTRRYYDTKRCNKMRRYEKIRKDTILRKKSATGHAWLHAPQRRLEVWENSAKKNDDLNNP